MRVCSLILFFLCFSGPVRAQDAPPAPFSPDEIQHGFFQFDTIPAVPEDMSPDPLDYYKNPALDSSGIPDETPGGLFLHITMAESFEEDLDLRRGHRYYPIRPTEEFPSDALAVHVVFRVFQHYSAYQIIGRLFPEKVLFRDAFFRESGQEGWISPMKKRRLPGGGRRKRLSQVLRAVAGRLDSGALPGRHLRGVRSQRRHAHGHPALYGDAESLIATGGGNACGVAPWDGAGIHAKNPGSLL